MYFEHQTYRQFSYLSLTPNEYFFNKIDIFSSVCEKIIMIIKSLKLRYKDIINEVLYKYDPKKWSFNDYCNEITILCDNIIVKSQTF